MAKSFGSGQPARTAQADLDRYFFTARLNPLFSDYGSQGISLECLIDYGREREHLNSTDDSEVNTIGPRVTHHFIYTVIIVQVKKKPQTTFYPYPHF